MMKETDGCCSSQTSSCSSAEPVTSKTQAQGCCGFDSEAGGEKQSTLSVGCCGPSQPEASGSCCDSDSAKVDWLLWGSLIGVGVLYLGYLFGVAEWAGIVWLKTIGASVFELMNTMWWGLALGLVMVSIIGQIPRELIMSVLGTKSGLNGILRATAAGVLLDLCSHGILMVGARLYERGASLGQLMAFLIASPWNSFSLTLILIALIGLPWTLAFIILSMLIAILTGVIFDRLEARGVLPVNPNQSDLPDGFKFWPSAKQSFQQTRFDAAWLKHTVVDGVQGSRMVIRWLLFGVLLASLIRTFLPAEHFAEYFGPTMVGLMLTMIASTIIEVCSEGSTPIAADLVTRAGAPGNGFAFLMTGVATDYTEIMVIKDTTKSWKVALFLPLISLPQVLVVAWLMNHFSL
ncbi:permease [Aurantivibrio plasticivorans]